MNAAWRLFKGTNFARSMSALWKAGTMSSRDALRGGFRYAKRQGFSVPRGSAARAGRRRAAEGMAGAWRKRAPQMAKEYFWPGTQNTAWSGMGFSKNASMTVKQARMARLRRTGGAAVGAWAGINALRRGDQIGPF
jgi:hypothetical protein